MLITLHERALKDALAPSMIHNVDAVDLGMLAFIGGHENGVSLLTLYERFDDKIPSQNLAYRLLEMAEFGLVGLAAG